MVSFDFFLIQKTLGDFSQEHIWRVASTEENTKEKYATTEWYATRNTSLSGRLPNIHTNYASHSDC